MDDRQFDAVSRVLGSVSPRRALARVAGGLSVAASFATISGTASMAKKKRKKKPQPPCRPVVEVTTVASDCFRGGSVGTAGAVELGQPFLARRTGRLAGVDVTARSNRGGQYAVEVRDLTQGLGISDAPVIGSATVEVPAQAQGEERLLTVRFTNGAVLEAGDRYALVVRRLNADGETGSFRPADPNLCFGAEDLLRRNAGEATFTPVSGFRLEHTVYVVP